MLLRHKKYVFLSLALCLCMGMNGQSQSDAKRWFAAGEYEKAKPVFAKLVKGNPRSGSLNYWYGVCLNETGEHKKALPYLEKAVERDVENAYRYIGDYYLEDGEYELAIENYEIYLDKVDPADSRFEEYTKRMEQANREFKYVRKVQKVVIVDSVILPKKHFLSAYLLSKENGSLSTTPQMIKESKTVEGTAYRTEIGDKIYYSDVDDSGQLQLYMRYKMLDGWSQPTVLEGMPEGDNNYPYMSSDGVTIYFANNSLEGLGGYDIFVTRFNTNTNRYLLPENMGMPFNSTANDYMMVIDEINELGWFATDRNQPDSLVCVYTFIPSKEKLYYDYDEDDRRKILAAANISSIAETQADGKAVQKARKTLLEISLQNMQTEKNAPEFTFVIDDFTDYHHLKDFKSPKARELYEEWQRKGESLKKLTKQLEDQRMLYTRSSASERNRMTPQLLKLEKQQEELETEVAGMERLIRNAEIEHVQKK